MLRSPDTKTIVLICAWLILFTEVIAISIYHQEVWDFIKHYGWIAPVLLLKNFLKKFLLLNLYGIISVIGTLIIHLLKLLIVKILKTFGIRYGAYFSSQKWQKLTQRTRIITKTLNQKKKTLQQFVVSFRKHEYAIIIIAFFPIFLVLFLFGIAFKMTRETMVKKGGELSITRATINTVKKNKGLVGKLNQLDEWILKRIEKLAQNN